LEYARTTSYPNYAVVGNTKPNLDFKTNRMPQPIFATKMAIPQGPFAPIQPIKASGLGGRKPIQIDYISKPLEKRQPKGLLWEPNSIRELYGNVYPDGLPKNSVGAQAANSAYLDALNNEKKQKQLEERYNQRLRVGRNADDIKEIDRGGRGRPHPDARMEEELKRLDEMLADTRYGKGPYKNIALNAEQHRQMAERQAAEIKEELRLLRRGVLDLPSDIGSAIALTESSAGTSRRSSVGSVGSVESEGGYFSEATPSSRQSSRRSLGSSENIYLSEEKEAPLLSVERYEEILEDEKKMDEYVDDLTEVSLDNRYQVQAVIAFVISSVEGSRYNLTETDARTSIDTIYDMIERDLNAGRAIPRTIEEFKQFVKQKYERMAKLRVRMRRRSVVVESKSSPLGSSSGRFG